MNLTNMRDEQGLRMRMGIGMFMASLISLLSTHTAT